MTVAELMAELSEFPPQMQVIYFGSSYDIDVVQIDEVALRGPDGIEPAVTLLDKRTARRRG